MKNLIILISIVVLTSCSRCDQNKYFGLAKPNDTPLMFNPDFILDSVYVQNTSFSADGKEFYYIETDGNWSYSKLFMVNNDMKEVKAIELFSELSFKLVPYVSPDNTKLFFIASKSDSIISGDVFVSERTSTGWGKPMVLPNHISSKFNEWEVSVSSNNTLYFSSDRPGGFGSMDIYKSEFKDGQYQEAVNLGGNINTASLDECAYIAPDESYMIFNSWKKAAQKGNNLYISFNDDGIWTKPINLGNKINTDELDIYPNVSPDGKYLFFTRREKPYNCTKPSKLYWVSTSFIDSLSEQVHHTQKDQ